MHAHTLTHTRQGNRDEITVYLEKNVERCSWEGLYRRGCTLKVEKAITWRTYSVVQAGRMHGGPQKQGTEGGAQDS